MNIYFFFSVRERAVFYKSCNLIGSESGQYSPHPAHSQRAVSDPLRDEIITISSSMKNSKLNILKNREFLKSREVLLSKKKQLVFEEVKGNRPQLQKNYPTPKTICCLIPVNLMLKTLKPSNTQFAPVKKKKAQSPRSPRKEELSSAMILILILIS